MAGAQKAPQVPQGCLTGRRLGAYSEHMFNLLPAGSVSPENSGTEISGKRYVPPVVPQWVWARSVEGDLRRYLLVPASKQSHPIDYKGNGAGVIQKTSPD